MTEVTLTACIIAIVRAVKEYVPAIAGIYTLVLAMVLGAVAGYFNVEGVSITQGVIIGIGAVGVVTTVQRVGK